MVEKIQFYSQIPGQHISGNNYLLDVIKIAQLSERSGFDGTLLFFNHHVLDPWVIASVILSNTKKLIPLIATQPYIIPPITAVKMIQSLTYLYNRRIDLNLLSGARESELREVNALDTDKLSRFKRLEEYITILRNLLIRDLPFDYDGEYYKYKGLQLSPKISEEQMPVFFVPGSSPEALSTAQKFGDVTLFRPEPFSQFKKFCVENLIGSNIPTAIRISLVTRPTSKEAWDIAEFRYPSDKDGIIKTRMRKNSVSNNNKTMASLALKQEVYDNVFWMGALLRAKSADPFLVGSYEEVTEYLTQYLDLGVKIVLIGNVHSEEDFLHFSNMRSLVNRLHSSI